MLNKEAYANQIVDIALTGKEIALVDDMPVPCPSTTCKECQLSHEVDTCLAVLNRWANKEFYQGFELLDIELNLLKDFAKRKYQYICKNYDGDIELFKENPIKDEESKTWKSDFYHEKITIFSDLFPFLGWDKNSGAISIDYILKHNVIIDSRTTGGFWIKV